MASRGLAATRLADYAKGFSSIKGKTDVVYSFYQAPAPEPRELGLEVGYLKERGGIAQALILEISQLWV